MFRLRNQTWIVIPAYNEQTTLFNVIMSLKFAGYYNIIVVDDASTDNTLHVAQQCKVGIVGHNVNQGQGAALSNGIQCAIEHGAQYIVTFDADGQHCATDLDHMLLTLHNSGTDIVLGNRFSTSRVPLLRKVLLHGAKIVVKLFYGVNVSDVHNGLRILSHNAATKIKITEPRMAHASEILDQIGKHKLHYLEVPVTVQYTAYSVAKGQSSFNALNILWSMVKNKFRGKQHNDKK